MREDNEPAVFDTVFNNYLQSTFTYGMFSDLLADLSFLLIIVTNLFVPLFGSAIVSPRDTTKYPKDCIFLTIIM
jgi:hypothetical protein